MLSLIVVSKMITFLSAQKLTYGLSAESSTDSFSPSTPVSVMGKPSPLVISSKPALHTRSTTPSLCPLMRYCCVRQPIFNACPNLLQSPRCCDLNIFANAQYVRRNVAIAKALVRICQIIRNEKLCRSWGNDTKSTKSCRGGAPTSIRVKDKDGYTLYDTQSGVETHAPRLLVGRFKLARDAPICEGQLFDDIGYLGNTKVTSDNLLGNYPFLSNMDPHTHFSVKRLTRSS